MVQLRSILNHHGFEYPTSGRKIQLVQLFNEKIGAAHGQLGHGPSRKENPTVSRIERHTEAASALPNVSFQSDKGALLPPLTEPRNVANSGTSNNEELVPSSGKPQHRASNRSQSSSKTQTGSQPRPPHLSTAMPDSRADSGRDLADSGESGWKYNDNVFQLGAQVRKLRKSGEDASSSDKPQHRASNRSQSSSNTQTGTQLRPPHLSTAMPDSRADSGRDLADSGESGWKYNDNVFQLGAQVRKLRKSGEDASSSDKPQHRAASRFQDIIRIDDVNLPSPSSKSSPIKPRTKKQAYATADPTESQTGARSRPRHLFEDPLFLLGLTSRRSRTKKDESPHIPEDCEEGDWSEIVVAGGPSSIPASGSPPMPEEAPDWLPALRDVMDDLTWDEQPSVDLLRERDHGLFIAHSQPKLTWACMLKLRALSVWSHHKHETYVCVLALLGFAWFWFQRRSAAADAKCVADISQIVLVKLKEKAGDPTAQSPYLLPARLHDELLQYEPAVMERQRIWGMVERVVGANANMRISLEETIEGEETLVWTWVGSL
ncbi:hypothetical protein FOMPIDRAFT_1056622 [Fomitopsis schrenkii]|uniref:Man1/Src1 C-terminal domain-containing protein n=1 Tax=Fomitopsis schrenkii TaxID=2126942 RepID=S8DN52_FOMSC|nr:hypothetical protein FOMPIDRAFT_1056622 [Fomitopsis schrenkii]